MLSLVIPAYNESKIITDTVKTASLFLSDLTDDWELIVVDDGSTDDTYAKLRSIGDDRIKIIHYMPNQGKGYAVSRGMLAAKGKYVFFTDADLAYGLHVIKTGRDLLESTGADLVIGNRRFAKSAFEKYPLFRKITSNAFHLAAYALSGMNYDTQCGFKCFKKTAAEKIFELCTEKGFAFDFEVMLLANKLNLTVEQMPVKILNHRKSKVNIFSDSIKMARSILRIRRRIGK